MKTIIIQVENIENIERFLIGANYRQAYNLLLELFEPYPEFRETAEIIVRRYNDFENEVVTGTVSLSERLVIKQDIAESCKKCLDKFKECHLKDCRPEGYQREEIHLIENRNCMRRTKMKIEDDLVECEDSKKMNLLENILAEIRRILKRLDTLIQYFTEIRNYEKI